MTKQQIIAELRRSAVEDAWPWGDVDIDAFQAARQLCISTDSMADMMRGNLRTFFLLVAEALDD